MSDTIPPGEIPLQPENDLEGVMVQVAGGTRDESAFFERLWESEVLVPQEGPAEDDVHELPAEVGAEIGLQTLRAHGRRTVPVYSSAAQMRKVAPREWSRYVRLRVSALQEMLAGTDAHLFINPSGDLSTMLDPVQLAALPVSRPAATKLDATAAVAPAEVDEQAAVVLRGYFESVPAIQAAYAVAIDERLTVGVVLDAGASPATVLADASSALDRPELTSMGMLAIDGSAPGPVGSQILSSARPFYER